MYREVNWTEKLEKLKIICRLGKNELKDKIKDGDCLLLKS